MRLFSKTGPRKNDGNQSCYSANFLASFNSLQCAATVVSGLTAEYLPAEPLSHLATYMPRSVYQRSHVFGEGGGGEGGPAFELSGIL